MSVDKNPISIVMKDFYVYLLHTFLAAINPAIPSNKLRSFHDDQMDQYHEKIGDSQIRMESLMLEWEMSSPQNIRIRQTGSTQSPNFY